MTRCLPHKRVPTKVTAYVDEGIKELIEILNTFELVAKLSYHFPHSCMVVVGDIIVALLTGGATWVGELIIGYGHWLKQSDYVHCSALLLECQR